jgi:hypothetical protein
MKKELPKMKLKTTTDYAKEMTHGAGMGKHMDEIVKAAVKGASLGSMMKGIGKAAKHVVNTNTTAMMPRGAKNY